jgi:uncharacterized protein (TIGR02266 family)
MSQLRSDELHRQESEIARAEAELAAREVALAGKEIELEARLSSERDRLHTLEEKLRALAQAGSEEADAFLEQLPELPPAPGYADRLKAVAARRDAVNARSESMGAREKALGVLSSGLARTDGTVAAAEAESNRIESAFAALKRKQAEERRAQASKPAAPPPPPLPPVVAPVVAPAVAAVVAATPVAAAAPQPLGRMEPPKNRSAAKPAGKDAKPGPRQRTRLDCDVSFESESNFFEGFARNLSEGGLFVAAWDYQAVGTEMDVAFSIPGGPRIEARAVVRWVRELNDATPDVWPGMGLQFTTLPAGAEDAIRKFMATREPIFFPD